MHRLDTFLHSLAAMAISTVLAHPAQAIQGAGPDSPDAYDPEVALQRSQAAIGNRVGDYVLLDSEGKSVRLTDFAGKPLLISLIFTSCYHTCPVTTRYLARAAANAREVLGKDSFHLLTIGFDSSNDTPESMHAFARSQGINEQNWSFLSGSPEAIANVVSDLGFIYFPSPRGFDHIVQLTIVDRDSVVYRQVYGEAFELPWLMEPLKELVYNRPRADSSQLDGLLDRVKLFCTVYDPATGRYKFDYSLFIQIGVGFMMVLSIAVYLLREARRGRDRV